MNNDNILKLKDENGNILEYEVLLVFKWYKTNKNYIVYTDKYNLNDEINVYANIFDPNDDSVFESIDTEEEWNEIDNQLKNIMGDNNG